MRGGELLQKLKNIFLTAQCQYQTAADCRIISGGGALICGYLAALLEVVLLILPHLPLKFIWSAPLFWGLFFVFNGCCLRWLTQCGGLFEVPGRKPWRGALVIAAAILALCLIRLQMLGLESFPDIEKQWQEAQLGKFSDWHPVVHTFGLYLFRQIYDSMYLVSICSILVYSVLCGWLYYTLRQYNCRWFTAAAVTLLAAFGRMNLFAMRTIWKDNAFMLAVFGIAIIMIHLFCTRGRWLEKYYNQILLALLLFYAAFVRHNGIFFTVFFVLLLPVVAEKRQLRWKLTAFSTAVLLLCGGYIAARSVMFKHNMIIKVESQSFAEAVGVPMTMMCHAYVNAPEKLPTEVRAFMERKLSCEKWREYYRGDFNSVKFSVSENLLADITAAEFFQLWYMTVQSAPCEALAGAYGVTRLGWDPLWFDFQRPYRWWSFIPMLNPSPAPGKYVLLLLAAALLLLPQLGYRVCFMVLPFAAYNYGTALLLMGQDHRFFWGVIVGSIPALAGLLIAAEKKARTAENVKPANNN